MPLEIGLGGWFARTSGRWKGRGRRPGGGLRHRPAQVFANWTKL